MSEVSQPIKLFLLVLGFYYLVANFFYLADVLADYLNKAVAYAQSLI